LQIDTGSGSDLFLLNLLHLLVLDSLIFFLHVDDESSHSIEESVHSEDESSFKHSDDSSLQ